MKRATESTTMSAEKETQRENECDNERSRNREVGKNLHNVSNTSNWDISTDTSMNKTWAELLDEEENFNQISDPVNDSFVGKDETEVQEINMPVSDNVNNVKEFETNVNIKEELEDRKDEEARLQKELDLFEHEWVRELKQSNENLVTEESVTHVSSVAIKEEKNDKTKETCDKASNKKCIDSKERIANKVKSDLCELISEELVTKTQIKKECDGNSSAPECRDKRCLKKEETAVCSKMKEENLHDIKFEDFINLKSENVNINKFKEEGSRKRGRNSQSDNIPGRVTQRNESQKKSRQVIEHETDPNVLSRRQKQIDYGKNTVGYDRYRQLVPKDKRTKTHPQTPPKHIKYSRRAWDGIVRVWRQSLHFWDPPSEGKLDISDTLSDISVDVTSQASEEMSDNERRVRVKRSTQSSSGSCSLEDGNDDYLILDETYTND